MTYAMAEIQLYSRCEEHNNKPIEPIKNEYLNREHIN
jgi:hypothetical protein